MELAEMKVEKSKFQLTELGKFPKEWRIESLENCCSKITDGTHDTPQKVSHGIPYITAIHVKEDSIDFDNCYYLPEEIHRSIYRRCNPEYHDVLMVNIGAGVGTTSIVDVDYEFSLKNVALLKPNNRVTSGTYLNFVLTHFKTKIISKLLSGGAQDFLSLGKISEIKILLPPTLKEQQAIAESLSDVDTLIAELDALIEKKQQIKKGAMQQLLTPPEPGQAGKKRLPGFDGEWEEKTFDECFHFLKTGTNSRSDLSDNGGVGYIHYGDIHAKWTDVLNCDEDSIPSIHKNKVTHLPRLEEGDLILADASEDYEGVGAGVEVKNLNGRQVVAGLHTILLRAKDGCIADGYKAYITSTKTVKKSLREIATGTTVYGISKSKLKQVKILLPPTIEEQKAIARILSDMDAEIQALQGKRRKYEKIKQGMMQELLTGKTRLV